MFTSLTIENFKAFAKSQSIPLRPITLLFGANSSGKSSAIHALLVLKQTLEESEDRNRALLPKGSLVDLGSFKELSFAHRTEFPVRIGLGLRLEDLPRSARRQMNRKHSSDLEEGHMVFSFSAKSGNVELTAFELQSPLGETVLESKLQPGRSRPALANEVPELFFSMGEPPGGRAFSPVKVSREPRLYEKHWYRLEPELDQRRDQMKDELTQLTRHLKMLKKRFPRREKGPTKESDEQYGEEVTFYTEQVKRLRAAIRRTNSYSLEKFIEDSVETQKAQRFRMRNFLPIALMPGKRDSPVFEQLYGGVGRGRHAQQRGVPSGAVLAETAYNLGYAMMMLLPQIVYLGPLRSHPQRHYIFSGSIPTDVGKAGGSMPDLLFKRPELVGKVNTWLERFGADCEIQMSTVGDEHISDVYSLRLVDKSTGVSVSALDVGFGISQILPILVQGLLNRNNTLLIEQPEIHLHPRLQAEFGSFLAEAIGDNRNNQFIIETHSEHLLLRLQRLVRKGTLRPEDVSIVYVQKTKAGSVTSSLRMDEEGAFIDRWPDGFFEEGFVERFGS